ncbi:MAG: 1-acyl-sn-glycerol-3-phosphate acyltransferase, partial [Lacticaseibacillus paracasei]|nr:1-acyl-sn-glycerol-3-phosphate acyltransferase [Lacticaseibacillus paracasei]
MKSGKFVGPDRAAVIENIRRAVAARAFNVKVEEHDPTFSEAQETAIIDHYLHQRQRWTFRVKTFICRLLVNA